MGQYFKGVILNENNAPVKYARSWDHGSNGAKLMEHSWMPNQFVNVIALLIANNPTKVVWAGDYADPEVGDEGQPLKDSDGHDITLYSICDDEDERIGFPLNYMDKYPMPERIAETPKKLLPKSYKYLVNHETKQFIDMSKTPLSDTWTDAKGKVWPFVIHALPLMTCEGNGRGGGDFGDEGANPLVGAWARNLISLETKKPKGFEMITFDLKE